MKKQMNAILFISVFATSTSFAQTYKYVDGRLTQVITNGNQTEYRVVPQREMERAQQNFAAQAQREQQAAAAQLQQQGGGAVQQQNFSQQDQNSMRNSYNSGSYERDAAALNAQNQSNNPQPVTAADAGKAASSAKSSQSGQIIMIGTSLGVAGFMGVKCANPTTAAWGCPMAAMSLAQAASLFGSSAGAGRAGDALSTGGGYNYNPGGGSGGANPGGYPGAGPTPNGLGDPTGAGGNGKGISGIDPNVIGNDPRLSEYLKEYTALSKGLAKSGYKMSDDGKSVIGPDGKKTPTSAFSSPQAMQAAGFGMDDIAAMNSALDAAGKKAQDKLRAVQMQAEGGGGAGNGFGAGAGGAGGGGGYGGSGYGNQYGRNGRGGSGSNRQVAGMMKKLGNDNIGVAGDNIFEMINRRYEARDKANNFLKE